MLPNCSLKEGWFWDLGQIHEISSWEARRMEYNTAYSILTFSCDNSDITDSYNKPQIFHRFSYFFIDYNLTYNSGRLAKLNEHEMNSNNQQHWYTFWLTKSAQNSKRLSLGNKTRPLMSRWVFLHLVDGAAAQSIFSLMSYHYIVPKAFLGSDHLFLKMLHTLTSVPSSCGSTPALHVCACTIKEFVREYVIQRASPNMHVHVCVSMH